MFGFATGIFQGRSPLCLYLLLGARRCFPGGDELVLGSLGFRTGRGEIPGQFHRPACHRRLFIRDAAMLAGCFRPGTPQAAPAFPHGRREPHGGLRRPAGDTYQNHPVIRRFRTERFQLPGQGGTTLSALSRGGPEPDAPVIGFLQSGALLLRSFLFACQKASGIA